MTTGLCLCKWLSLLCARDGLDRAVARTVTLAKLQLLPAIKNQLACYLSHKVMATEVLALIAHTLFTVSHFAGLENKKLG